MSYQDGLLSGDSGGECLIYVERRIYCLDPANDYILPPFGEMSN